VVEVLPHEEEVVVVVNHLRNAPAITTP